VISREGTRGGRGRGGQQRGRGNRGGRGTRGYNGNRDRGYDQRNDEQVEYQSNDELQESLDEDSDGSGPLNEEEERFIDERVRENKEKLDGIVSVSNSIYMINHFFNSKHNIFKFTFTLSSARAN